MGWVDSPTQRVLLPKSAVQASNPRGDVQITLMTSADWSITQKGEEFRLRPNDLLVSNLQESFDLRRGGRTRTMTLFLPRPWVLSWVPNIDFEKPMVLQGDAGWARVLSTVLCELTPDRVPWLLKQSREVDAQIGSILSLVFHECGLSSQGHCLDSNKRLEMVKACIRRRFMDCGLTAADVAAEAGLSERSLRRLCSQSGHSFYEMLTAERMAAAKRLLTQRTYERISIALIGQRVGFNDASHFVRRFKSEFGTTPSKMRSQHLSSPSGEIVGD